MRLDLTKRLAGQKSRLQLGISRQFITIYHNCHTRGISDPASYSVKLKYKIICPSHKDSHHLNIVVLIQFPLGHCRVNTMRQEIAVFLVSVLAAVRGQFPFFQDNFFFGGCPGVEVEQDFSLEMVRLLYMHTLWHFFKRWTRYRPARLQ